MFLRGDTRRAANKSVSTGQAIDEIRRAVGDDAISTDDEDLIAHGYSEWSTTNTERLPIAVVYPRSTEEVSQIAKICHKYRVPMSMSPLIGNKPRRCPLMIASAVPFSGGTSLEGNFAAPYGGMSIDFTHMDKVLDFHEDEYAPFEPPSLLLCGSLIGRFKLAWISLSNPLYRG
jgi:D-lactate dehydrogenase (cytochrome)